MWALLAALYTGVYNTIMLPKKDRLALFRVRGRLYKKNSHMNVCKTPPLVNNRTECEYRNAVTHQFLWFDRKKWAT